MDFDGDAGSPGVRVQTGWPSEFDSEMRPIKKRFEALPLFTSQQSGTWSDFSLLENLVRKQFKSRAWFKPISRCTTVTKNLLTVTVLISAFSYRCFHLTCTTGVHVLTDSEVPQVLVLRSEPYCPGITNDACAASPSA